MKTKIFFSLLLIIFNFTFLSETIKADETFFRNFEDAKLIAEEFFSENNSINSSNLSKDESSSEIDGQIIDDNLYIFNSNDDGFIIIAADKRVSEVLAYSKTGNFDFNNKENIKNFIQSYLKQLNTIKSTSENNEFQIYESFEDKGIDKVPLLDIKGIKYGQNYPYNLKTPLIEKSKNKKYAYKVGKNTVTGCVATAIAQIMKYYEFPLRGLKDHQYYLSSSYIKFKKLFSPISQKKYNWENILPTYSGGESREQKEAIADLMLDIGISVNTTYGIESASNNEAALIALKENFGYGENLSIKKRKNYSEEEWSEILDYEINNKRPVYYSGYSKIGAHAFVVDGKDNNGFYHINWGWNGGSNGYFKLDSLNPHNNSLKGYNYNQEAITGIDAKNN